MCHCSWLAMKRISLILINADFRIKLFLQVYTIFAPSYMHVSIRILCWATILAFFYCLLSCGFEFCSMFSKVTVPKVLFLDRTFSLWTSTNLTIFYLFTPSLKFDLCICTLCTCIYTKSLVNTNSFYKNFTNTHFQKVPIPHLTRTMKQKFLH